VEAPIIDAGNILQATHRAMNQALAMLNPPPAHALVDGLKVTSLRFPQTPLVQGDARSYSIAAASVIAKVTRDRLMVEYDRIYPAYAFAEHKGYGTPQHLAALALHGPCPLHRRSFAPVRRQDPELELFTTHSTVESLGQNQSPLGVEEFPGTSGPWPVGRTGGEAPSPEARP
jgi:ribonuclease HII